jgi:hypothetical protein
MPSVLPNLPDLPVIIPIVMRAHRRRHHRHDQRLDDRKAQHGAFIATSVCPQSYTASTASIWRRNPTVPAPWRHQGIAHDLSSYKIFGISIAVYIALIITIIVWFVLNRTV